MSDLVGNSRPRVSGATRLRDADPQSVIEVTVDLSAPKLPNTDHLPQAALNSAEFKTNYAARSSNADEVRRVLEGCGLKVEEVSLVTHSMRVSGSVEAMEAAFQPNLGIYESEEQGEFRGREGGLKIPSQLDGIVTGVFGFDQRRVSRRRSILAVTEVPALTPRELEIRYNFPNGDGQGQRIAIAEFGGGYFEDDLSAFCARHARATPRVEVVAVNRQPLTLAQIQKMPLADQRDALLEASEVMMDVEIIAGLCPRADISIYFATIDQKGWIDLLNRIIEDPPVTLSISWSWPEDSPDWSEAGLAAINDRLNALAVLGVTTCVATGDDGSATQLLDQHAHVEFPSSSPFVLSVGGTMLTASPMGLTEVAWWQAPGHRTNGGAGAGGGGVSVVWDRPRWQNGVSVQSANAGGVDGRVIPDVAALAGPPYYAITFQGKNERDGGTSAATPLWAALVARITAALPSSKRQRFLTPLLYRAGQNGQRPPGSACHDITEGKNVSDPPGVGYHAGVGFDAVTGWGTPDGSALLEALNLSVT